MIGVVLVSVALFLLHRAESSPIQGNSYIYAKAIAATRPPTVTEMGKMKQELVPRIWRTLLIEETKNKTFNIINHF